LAFLTVSRCATAAGTRTTSLPALARVGLANAVRPALERKMIVLCLRVERKCLPRMTSTWPTLMRIGATRVITGVGPDFLAVATPGTAATTATADSASRQVRMRRRIAIPLLSASLVAG
jgi:hypothetical protein